ncbi:acetyl-CoA carboxylase biotin carboxyl carrier protein [Granulicatella seriolae]|uniref:Biotin carboxyl carrier protein of acetyl-CoA carboxylase n=1 Tax=Granulicatella seriolae TaxID=2967226 RepID=A0ABT1WLX3_9LACT|nr:acetyl-CoA carboxylase biotin carboxyl carrier protein [Granulicatella seriolae]
MDLQEIKDIIEKFDASSIMELSLNHKDTSLALSKRVDQPHQAESRLVEEKISKEIVSTAKEESAVVPVTVPVEESQEDSVDYITSPIVGLVYLASGPQEAPFVQVGQDLKEGQVVCIVEAMKIMNEITSPYSGQVLEVLVENGQMVDYGQAIIKISK